MKNKPLEAYRTLINLNYNNDCSNLTCDNEIQILVNGRAKFDALLQDIDRAEDFIHLLYYKINNDETGRCLIKALTAKAAQGIEVKLIYDRTGSLGLHLILNPLLQAGGQALPFLPANILSVKLPLNSRNHRKIAVIDGKIGYMGGINIGDEYLCKSSKFGYWRDTHLRIKGSVVHQLEAHFLFDWMLVSQEKLKSNKVRYKPRYFPQPEKGGASAVQIVSSGPLSEKQQIKDAFIKMIFEAKQSILIQTPYFLPDDNMIDALRTASLSGVDVRIMIPCKSDHFIVKWISSYYVNELFDSGIKFYLYKRGFIHAKILITDSEIASVGSSNLDNRSFEHNFEINAFIYDSQIAHQLAEIFYQDIIDCNLFDTGNRHKVFTKARESISKLLSPFL